jgi:hypothetical protein
VEQGVAAMTIRVRGTKAKSCVVLGNGVSRRSGTLLGSSGRNRVANA